MMMIVKQMNVRFGANWPGVAAWVWAASISPPSEPINPPRMRLCILKATTFLPRARAASSSSRMLLSTRPHGLRINAHTSTRHDGDDRPAEDHHPQPVAVEGLGTDPESVVVHPRVEVLEELGPALLARRSHR